MTWALLLPCEAMEIIPTESFLFYCLHLFFSIYIPRAAVETTTLGTCVQKCIRDAHNYVYAYKPLYMHRHRHTCRAYHAVRDTATDTQSHTELDIQAG